MKSKLFLVFSITTLLGAGFTISSVLGAFTADEPWWFYLMGVALGVAMMAISAFMVKVMLFGSDRDVEDTDITGGFN